PPARSRPPRSPRAPQPRRAGAGDGARVMVARHCPTLPRVPERERDAAVERFADLVVDAPLDVTLLSIAAALRPPVDEIAALAQLDAWAAQCEDATFDAVRHVLFDHDRLAGDIDDYGDPEN